MEPQPTRRIGRESLAVADWPRVIRQEGRSCLSGKFNPTWTINGEKADASGKSGFVYTAFLGFRNESMHYYDPLSWYDVVLYEQYEQSDKNANYLIISQPFDGSTKLGEVLRLKPNDRFVAIHYVFYSHKDFTLDARGHHILTNWMLYLPEARLVNFMQTFTDNPQVLDGLFKQMHQGLISEGGMQRVKVAKLRIMENVAKPASQAVAQETIRQRKWREVIMATPIGEQN